MATPEDPMKAVCLHMATTSQAIQENPTLRKIVQMVCEHDFYAGPVCSECLTAQMPCYNGAGCLTERQFTMLDVGPQKDCGFHITYLYPTGTAEVQYIFILPKFRRKGITSAYLEILKGQHKKVIVNTSEAPMKACVKKLGFTFDRLCDNGVEDSYEFIS
jgi:hypothetical protein